MSASTTIQLGGQHLHVDVESARWLVGELRTFLRAHEPWHAYAGATRLAGYLYGCSRCPATTTDPGACDWRWRLVHKPGRGRHTEAICRACHAKEGGAAP